MSSSRTRSKSYIEPARADFGGEPPGFRHAVPGCLLIGLCLNRGGVPTAILQLPVVWVAWLVGPRRRRSLLSPLLISAFWGPAGWLEKEGGSKLMPVMQKRYFVCASSVRCPRCDRLTC